MPNSTAAGPLGFYTMGFKIENNLPRNILTAIPPDRLDGVTVPSIYGESGDTALS